MLFQGKNRLDWQKLIRYALIFQSQSLVQRLGYLLDFLNIKIPDEERNKLLSQVEKTYCYLGRPTKWGKGGKHNATWQVVSNIPQSELLAAISARSCPASFSCSKASHEQQHQQDYHNQSQPAARAIAPASAVRPGGQRTQKHQDQEHNQNSGNGNHLSSPLQQ